MTVRGEPHRLALLYLATVVDLTGHPRRRQPFLLYGRRKQQEGDNGPESSTASTSSMYASTGRISTIRNPPGGWGDDMTPKRPGEQVRIEITPTPAEYKQLCADLQALRNQGAHTNTAAILAAVHDAARQRKIALRKRSKQTRGALERSPVPQQEMELPDAPQR